MRGERNAEKEEKSKKYHRPDDRPRGILQSRYKKREREYPVYQ